MPREVNLTRQSWHPDRLTDSRFAIPRIQPCAEEEGPKCRVPLSLERSGCQRAIIFSTHLLSSDSSSSLPGWILRSSEPVCRCSLPDTQNSQSKDPSLGPEVLASSQASTASGAPVGPAQAQGLSHNSRHGQPGLCHQKPRRFIPATVSAVCGPCAS